jgi:hypothetical protein
MAYIDHRCSRCGHLWISHTMYGCSYNWCKQRCSRTEADFAEPELIMTYRAWHQPNREITQPGQPAFYTDPEAGRITLACNCEACQAKYQELVA